MSVITLTTDFGGGSPYVAVMKGVILSINPQATIVDVTHDIPAQDIRRGSVVLADVTVRFPPGTVHIAVVDPGVGTKRAILYARIGQQQYVCPDNGLLSCLVEKTPPSKLVRLANRKYWLDPVSATFHGRDIMAPVAAHLSLGVDPDDLGAPLDSMAELELPTVRQSPTRIEGQVIEVDSFGNLITNITADMLIGRPTDERVCIVCNIYETWGIYHTYGDQLNGTFVAVMGSTGRLELALVGGHAAERLGIGVGESVTASWG